MAAAARPPLDFLQECMKNPQHIRNVCILAHVDHGKTTIADSLLATNRLVSKRMAGFIRYMDDRLDEQERGITMKSSAVSLLNLVNQEPLLLNLIDTPGHIDFNTEVGAALRVCDGALIVVDLVEGVCVQTREAIKQAFTERCKMILILNKIDKLIIELNKDISEIFQLILHAIEDCNAIIAELYQYEYLNPTIDIEDTGLLFTPISGNVIFVSAIDGWGFTLKQMAAMFISVLKNETIDTLNEKLWNFDAYVDSKTNTIKFGALEKNKTNLFIQLCLKTIHYIYTTIITNMQRDKIPAIIDKLKIINITREMNHTDPKVQLRSILQAWSPIADVILLQCQKIVTPPSEIHSEKIKYLLEYNRFCEDEHQKNTLDELIIKFQQCSPHDPTCIAYVSKMFCVDNRNLSQNKPKPFIPKNSTTTNHIGENLNSRLVEEEETATIENLRDFSIIALARVFSGTLKINDEIYILPPQYTPASTNKLPQLVKIQQLYTLFGRELVLVNEITAGNICGIGGLDSAIVRTATLTTTLNTVPFVEHPTQAPILRNAIEPQNPRDLKTLQNGLRILMQSDSCVQVLIQETGEYVLLTAGNVHLTKCLEDLTSKFAKIQINVSSPMVSLRETILTNSRKDFDNSITINAQQIQLDVVVITLPDVIGKEIEKNYKILRSIEDHQQQSSYELSTKRNKNENLQLPQEKTFKNDITNNQLKYIKQHLTAIFATEKNIWSKFAGKIWTIGRSSDSINLLINDTNDYKRNIFETLDETDPRSSFDSLIINAFNSCCKSGPICEEPLKNCAFIIRKFEIFPQQQQTNSDSGTLFNIESTLSAGFREAFIKQPQQRLMEPMFTTTIQVNTTILGKVYSVLSKRHGKVLDAVGMDEQEKIFLVKAQIPVVESIGFGDEMRKTTSGQAIPNLKFSHFEIIDGDPYFNEATIVEDEDDEDGTINVDAAIRATKLRRDIRKRKGLHVEEQVVVHAEKQRTLNKKK